MELTEDDIPFLQLTELSADRILACNWQKVQEIPHVLFKEGFTGVRAKEKAFYLRYFKNFMRRLLSHFGVKDIEKCQYHITFLGNVRDNMSGEYICKYQIPTEILSLRRWKNLVIIGIFFIPLQTSGMVLNVQGSQPNQIFLYMVPFKKAICINANTVHLGGYCTDSKEGNLRMQICQY